MRETYRGDYVSATDRGVFLNQPRSCYNRLTDEEEINQIIEELEEAKEEL